MFSFTFDPSSGSEITLESPVMINSSSFRTLDFEVVMTASNQVKISYQGVARQFGPGESFAVKLSLTAPAVTGSGRVVAQGPAVRSRTSFSLSISVS